MLDNAVHDVTVHLQHNLKVEKQNNVFEYLFKWSMFYAATCTENGITYQEGDVWNPYFSKFGVVKCQICTCKVHNCL